MADVFISYAREDRMAAERIAKALERHGWSVWWDSDIPPGKTWDELIERELASASSTVVLWSATSIAKAWVKAEAAEALARGVLVPVLIEDVTPPLAFRHIQAAPLTDWRNTLDHGGFQQLLCSVCTLAGQPVRQGSPHTGQSSRLGRMRGKAATVPARSKHTASLCATPLPAAAKPADDVLAGMLSPLEARTTREPALLAAGTRGRLRRALAFGSLALVAATAGYGLRDALDGRLAPPPTLAGDARLPEAAAAPACIEPAAAKSPLTQSSLPLSASLR